MKFQSLSIKEKLGFLFLSLGGLGKAPFAPGTFGSALSVIYLYFMPRFSLAINLFFFLTIFMSAVKITTYFENKSKSHDPSWIVIDEFLGMVTVNLFFMTNDMIELVFIFAMFRFYDIFKPWPVSWADQKLNGALGTILDDIIAGVYAILTILVGKFISSNFFTQ